MYGLLESASDSAAVVPLVFRAVDTFYWAMAPFGIVDSGGSRFYPVWSQLHYSSDPTFFMGGTLPCSRRFFTDNVQEVERKVGVLYALNTFGAAAGSLLAALVFIPAWQPEDDSDHRFGQRGDRIVRDLAVRALAGRRKRG